MKKNKEMRREIEAMISNAINHTLSGKHEKAGRKMEKSVRTASKQIAKKFCKAVSTFEKVAVAKKAVKKVAVKAAPAKKRARA